MAFLLTSLIIFKAVTYVYLRSFKPLVKVKQSSHLDMALGLCSLQRASEYQKWWCIPKFEQSFHWNTCTSHHCSSWLWVFFQPGRSCGAFEPNQDCSRDIRVDGEGRALNMSHFCCPFKVLTEFMERWRNMAWSTEEDCDHDVEFWEQQKAEFLQENPTYLLAMAEMEGEDEDWYIVVFGAGMMRDALISTGKALMYSKFHVKVVSKA